MVPWMIGVGCGVWPMYPQLRTTGTKTGAGLTTFPMIGQYTGWTKYWNWWLFWSYRFWCCWLNCGGSFSCWLWGKSGSPSKIFFSAVLEVFTSSSSGFFSGVPRDALIFLIILRMSSSSETTIFFLLMQELTSLSMTLRKRFLTPF